MPVWKTGDPQKGSVGSIPISSANAAMVKWQTRWLQVPVLVRVCGFESHWLHHGMVEFWESCVMLVVHTAL